MSDIIILGYEYIRFNFLIILLLILYLIRNKLLNLKLCYFGKKSNLIDKSF